jgi:homoserine kinase type II
LNNALTNKQTNTQLELQNASDYFDLGNIKSFSKIDGNINENYLVKNSNDSQFIFKVLRKHQINDLMCEIVYLDRLEEHDYPAAYYLKNAKGESIFKYGKSKIIIQRRLEGSFPLMNSKVCLTIGQNIAKLHRISIKGLPLRNHWLNESFLSSQILLIQKYFPDKANLFVKTFNSLADFPYSKLTKTIVHGDLYDKNCLFNNNDLVAILDWEEVGIAPAILDLATCIFNFCFKNNIFSPKLYKAMMIGYQSNRVLTRLDLESLCLAIKYIGLTLSAWRLMQFGLYNPNPVLLEKHKIYWISDLDNLKLPVI